MIRCRLVGRLHEDACNALWADVQEACKDVIAIAIFAAAISSLSHFLPWGVAMRHAALDGDGMPLIVCYVIVYVQILTAGFNLWGGDPRVLVNTPVGRNTIFVGLFLLVQLLSLAGAVLMIQKIRLGFLLSIAHHVLLLPALVITSWGLVMLMDDRINAPLIFMSKPSGSDVAFYWSLGWGTVFQQVTRNVPNGSTFIGIKLFALACVLWTVLKEMDAGDARAPAEGEACPAGAARSAPIRNSNACIRSRTRGNRRECRQGAGEITSLMKYVHSLNNDAAM